MKNKKSGLWQAVRGVFVSQKEKIGILGIGHLVNALIVYGFDYLIYPYVVVKFGMLKGGFVMALISLMTCWLTILFYDTSKKDWLGIEMLKEVKIYKGGSTMRKWISKMVNQSEVLTLIVLSTQFDPFVTTAYMRRGIREYNGMGKRDWVIFLSSWVISNTYWIVASFYGATIAMRYWIAIKEICSIAMRVFVLLAVSTVIFKKRLFFITRSLSRYFSLFSGHGKKKILIMLLTESFAWATFLYAVLRFSWAL
jgi:hypothetical protein